MTTITTSPWGKPDTVTEYGPGVINVETPSHGGFWLSPDRLAQVPLAWRLARFHPSEDSPWFEEDSDWCMVALTFPELFFSDAVEIARLIFNRWIAPKVAT